MSIQPTQKRFGNSRSRPTNRPRISFPYWRFAFSDPNSCTSLAVQNPLVSLAHLFSRHSTANLGPSVDSVAGNLTAAALWRSRPRRSARGLWRPEGKRRERAICPGTTAWAHSSRWPRSATAEMDRVSRRALEAAARERMTVTENITAVGFIVRVFLGVKEENEFSLCFLKVLMAWRAADLGQGETLREVETSSMDAITRQTRRGHSILLKSRSK